MRRRIAPLTQFLLRNRAKDRIAGDMRMSPVRAALARCVCLLAAPVAVAACSTMNLPDAPKTVGVPVKSNPHYKIGAPYKIDGRWYVPQVDEKYDETGVASWYGDAFHGKLTANGEIFDKRRLSAAHKTLPLPTLVEVENLENGRKLVVRVNDRGPFVDDRVIDLSHAAADELGFSAKGLARVRVRYLAEADLTALAALPGEPSQHPIRVAERKSPPTPSPKKVENEDRLASLIAANVGATPIESAAASKPSELWVEIARFADLEELANFKLNLTDVGPVTVQSDDNGGGMQQSLRLGPYVDEAVAVASLSRVQAAGFGEARIIRSVGG